MTEDLSQEQKLHDLAMMANTQANEFARTGLAHLVLLNGGAIVAFGPIGSMFAVKMAQIKLYAFFTFIIRC